MKLTPVDQLPADFRTEILALEAAGRSEGSFKIEAAAMLSEGTAPVPGVDNGLRQQGERAQAQAIAGDVVRQQNFRKWFGDSQVVDDSGHPRVVYHGTTADFSVFDKSKSGDNSEHATADFGFFFTSNPDVTLAFSGTYEGADLDGQNTVATYLSIKNPAEMSAGEFADIAENDTGKAVRKIRANLISEGYDGIFIPGDIESEMEELHSDTWVAFYPEQIKSATGNAGTFDPTDPDMRYSLVGEDTIDAGIAAMKPIFLSALARALPSMAKIADKDGMVKPEQARLWLEARQREGKFKAEELQWSGVQDWLETRAGKVAVDDIALYLEEQGVQVHEVTKGKPGATVEKTNDGYAVIDTAGTAVATFDYLSQAESEASNYGDPTKYEKYVLPGGENYREMLLTLPIKPEPVDTTGWWANMIRPKSPVTGMPEYDVLDADNKSVGIVRSAANEEAAISVAAKGRERAPLHKAFTSSHWDEKNVVAHIRFNDRTDVDGKRVLFIEELQSDWGQQGLKRGFGYKDTEPLTQDEDRELMELFDLRDRTAAQSARMHALNDRLNASQGKAGIPAAPFVTDTKAWLGLGIKRMIRYAAENGYDRVAFVNGQQSADRYDLSKQVDKLVLYTDNTLVGFQGGRNVFAKIIANDAELADVIGKEMAERLLATKMDMNEQRVLSGASLKMGGDGMKAFYDKIVPQAINDVLKKLGGGKVSTVTMPDGRDMFILRNSKDQSEVGSFKTVEAMNSFYDQYRAAEREGNEMKVHSRDLVRDIHDGVMSQTGFDITPELRASALDGLPMFSRVPPQPIAPAIVAPIFFSALARAVPAMARIADKNGMVKPEQAQLWLAARQKEGQFKAEELQWSGVEDWLATHTGKVAVADITSFVEENGVQVDEVTKGAPAYNGTGFDDGSDSYAYFGVDGSVVQSGFTTEVAAASAMREQPDYEPEQTKYSQYVLPGGENYRELLLTLPKQIADPTPAIAQRKARLAAMDELAEEFPEKDFAEKAAVLRSQIAKLEAAPKPLISGEYLSSHWDERNVLAHVRFNDRTDAEGKRVLFIEELQSDWGQAGLKNGFVGQRPDLTPEQEAAIRTHYRALAVEMPKIFPADESDVNEMMRKLGTSEMRTALTKAGLPDVAESLHPSMGTVTPAPFVSDTKSWLALGIKRVIRYAAENGYDKVAFVNGEQSAARYDLSKHISRVQYEPIDNGNFEVEAKDWKGMNVFAEDDITIARIEQVLGKEIAEKIANRKGRKDDGGYRDWHHLEGVDLKVGGEGMKAFYDKIVPQTINDVLKKLGGGTAGTIRIPHEAAVDAMERGEVNSIDEMIDDFQYREQIGFEITSELRASALGGMPMFSRVPTENYDVANQSMRSSHAALGWSAERVKDLLGAYAYTTRPAMSKAYATWITPEQFLSLTTSNVANIAADATPLDVEKLADNAQELWLQLDDAPQDGMRITGHEGRHRAYAMQLAGIERFPVTIRLGAGAENKPLAALKLSGQDFGRGRVAPGSDVVLVALVPVSHAYAEELVDNFVATGDDNAPRFSRTSDAGRFAEWFGASKVVGTDGSPKQVYHGTNVEFNEFRKEQAGSSWDAGKLGEGFYFTTDQRLANSYANGAKAKTRDDSPRVIPAYVALQNPLEIGPLNWREGDNVWLRLREHSARLGIDIDPVSNLESNQPNPQWSRPFTEALQRAGHDGVILHFSDENMEVVAFEPNQIKSAVLNNGDYNPAVPDIRFQRRATPDLDDSAYLENRFTRARLTESDEFKEWFSGSQVARWDGTPTIVFHGTRVVDGDIGDIKAFDRKYTQKRFNRTQNFDMIGSWFSNTHDEEGAAKYTGRGDGATIYPVYLAIKNAKRFDTFEDFLTEWKVFNTSDAAAPEHREQHLQRVGSGDADGFTAHLKTQGFDGVMIPSHNSHEFLYQDVWLAFDAHQVRFALSPQGPEQRYQREFDSNAGIAFDGVSVDAILSNSGFIKNMGINAFGLSFVRLFGSFNDAKTKLEIEIDKSTDGAKEALAWLQENENRFGPVDSDSVLENKPETKNKRESAELLRWLNETKVVGNDGKPKILFHGTTEAIGEFDTTKTVDGGLHFGTAEQANMRASGSGKNLIPVFLNVTNPRRSKDAGGNWKAKIKAAKSADHDGIVYLNRYEGMTTDRISALDAAGMLSKLDGLTDAQFRDLVPEAQDSYIAFDASQVRFALDTPAMPKLTFVEENTAAYSGQSNMTLSAYVGSECVGHLDYVLFRGEVSVSMIDVPPEHRRNGYGTKLMQELQAKYPDVEIDLGMSTADGAALIKSLPKKVYPVDAVVEKLAEFAKCKAERDRLQQLCDKFFDMPERTEEDRAQLLIETGAMNDLHDAIDELETELHGARASRTVFDTPGGRRASASTYDSARYLRAPELPVIGVEDNPDLSAVKVLADVFGAKVALFRQSKDSTFKFNGVMRNNMIWLNEASAKPLHVVFGHEVLHLMRSERPDLYAGLYGALEPILRNEAGYIATYGLEGHSKAYVHEEMIADLLGDRFAEASFWDQVASHKPGLFAGIAGYVTGLIDKVKVAFSGSDYNRSLHSDRFVADLDSARSALAEVVAKYGADKHSRVTPSAPRGFFESISSPISAWARLGKPEFDATAVGAILAEDIDDELKTVYRDATCRDPAYADVFEWVTGSALGKQTDSGIKDRLLAVATRRGYVMAVPSKSVTVGEMARAGKAHALKESGQELASPLVTSRIVGEDIGPV